MTEEDRLQAVHEARRVGLAYQRMQQAEHGRLPGGVFCVSLPAVLLAVFREELTSFFVVGRVELDELEENWWVVRITEGD